LKSQKAVKKTIYEVKIIMEDENESQSADDNSDKNQQAEATPAQDEAKKQTVNQDTERGVLNFGRRIGS